MSMIGSKKNRGKYAGHAECNYGCCREMFKQKRKQRRILKRRERQEWKNNFLPKDER